MAAHGACCGVTACSSLSSVDPSDARALKTPDFLVRSETCEEQVLLPTGQKIDSVFSCKEKADRKKHPCLLRVRVACNNPSDQDIW